MRLGLHREKAALQNHVLGADASDILHKLRHHRFWWLPAGQFAHFCTEAQHFVIL